MYLIVTVLLLACVNISAQPLLPEHPVAETEEDLISQTDELVRRKDYAGALAVAEKLVARRTRVYGSSHAKVAESLDEAAWLHYQLGAYVDAKDHFETALGILEKTEGGNSPLLRRVLNNLGQTHYLLGAYDKAESSLRRAVDLFTESEGADDMAVAAPMTNLGAVYLAIKDYDKAAALLEKVLAITEKARGPEHPDVAGALNNLAEVYARSGVGFSRPWKVRGLYERALSVLEKRFGPEDPRLVPVLNNLGNFYANQSQFYPAERAFRRALEIGEKAVGPNDPFLTQLLYNFGHFYSRIGEYESAEPLLVRALTLARESLDAHHPVVATSLLSLALMHAYAGEYDEALSRFVEYHQVEDRLIDLVMGFTSGDQKRGYLLGQRGRLDQFLTLVVKHLAHEPEARGAAFDIWLRRKGMNLESERRFREALVDTRNRDAWKAFRALTRVRTEQSDLAFARPAPDRLEAYRKRLSELDAQEATLEAQLSRLSEPFLVAKQQAQATWKKVAEVLPPNSAIVDFGRVTIGDFEMKALSWIEHPPRYLAFILDAGADSQVRLLDLGDAQAIDKAVFRFKHSVNGTATPHAVAEASRPLYDLVFAPVRKELGQVTHVFVSPDGALSLVPFEAIQSPGGRFLIEDYTFNYLAAGRDIIGFGRRRAEGDTILLMGDPYFDLGLDDRAHMLKAMGLTAATAEGRNPRPVGWQGLHFARLPYTKEEVEAIKGLFEPEQVAIYTGSEALEEVLRAVPAPKILHLATHGFFLEDLPVSALPRRADRGLVVAPVGAWEADGSHTDPLLRSGIALAGANTTLRADNRQRHAGIVTAKKMLELDLHGTNLVVLSACETGTGVAAPGEGVYGLQQAVARAGAKSLVMSMWSVPDRETKELMVRFYGHIRSGTMSRAEALRRAELEQMDVTRKRYGDANPYYWGAFVFMGEP